MVCLRRCNVACKTSCSHAMGAYMATERERKVILRQYGALPLKVTVVGDHSCNHRLGMRWQPTFRTALRVKVTAVDGRSVFVRSAGR